VFVAYPLTPYPRDNDLRFGQGPLEIRAFARTDVEVRHFEDHCEISSADAERAHPLTGALHRMCSLPIR
jgi:hypothetical protein